MATQVTLNSGSVDSAGSLALKTNGTTTAVTIDTSQNVGIGTNSPATKFNLGGATDQTIQVNGSGTAAFLGTSTAVAQISSNRNPTTGAIYDSGRAVSYINLEASSGNANIQFYTTATNNVNATERMRIDSSGNLLLANGTQYYGLNQYNNKALMKFFYPTTGFGANNDCTDFSTAGNGSALVQMRITQAGNVGCRGTFSGGQTLNDYAEYFEWADGNPNNEDRIGLTVVLDGDKIRPSTSQDSGDDIIGVVSGTAGVVLGSSPFEWTGKYQKDEFGRTVTEQVTWVNWSADGINHNYKVNEIPVDVVAPTTVEYKTYNIPVVVEGYDESVEYLSRDQRKEWSAIGLVGQVHVKNGQLVGTRWKKMRDVSSNVAIWFIR